MEFDDVEYPSDLVIDWMARMIFRRTGKLRLSGVWLRIRISGLIWSVSGRWFGLGDSEFAAEWGEFTSE
jgi:hypothetical protein